MIGGDDGGIDETVQWGNELGLIVGNGWSREISNELRVISCIATLSKPVVESIAHVGIE